MKKEKKILSWCILLVGLIALMGCPNVTNGDTSDEGPKQESEPNDSVNEANDLESSRDAEGTVDGSDTDIWSSGGVEGYTYAFTASADSSITVTLKNKESGSYVTKWTESGTSISRTIDPDTDGYEISDGSGNYFWYYEITASSEANYTIKQETN